MITDWHEKWNEGDFPFLFVQLPNFMARQTHPVAMCYGWASNPPCDLYNKEGLPASPFRTDYWTTGKQAPVLAITAPLPNP